MKRIITIIIILTISFSLIGCNNDLEEKTANSNNEKEQVFEEKVYNWEGEITEIEKHQNMEDYSIVSWKGYSGGGSFTIKDSLVYEKYKLKKGQYISVKAKDTKDGLEIISIEKLKKRSSVKGIVESIDIKNSVLYLKVTDKDMYNKVIVIKKTDTTRFKHTLFETIKKGIL